QAPAYVDRACAQGGHDTRTRGDEPRPAAQCLHPTGWRRESRMKWRRSMRVKDVMATNVACCQAQTLLTDVACMMVDCDCGEIPVTDDAGRPIGVITDRDITCRAVAQGRNPLELTAADCMTSPPVTVTPEASLSECCDILEAKQIRRVPVVDQT